MGNKRVSERQFNRKMRPRNRPWVRAMRITFRVNNDALTQARLTAKRMGKSVNQLIREQLESLAGQQWRVEAAEAYMQSALASRYQLKLAI
jgi:predicted HicB family RNase H-like nuclease